jgi:hypothetical protein
MTNGQPQDKWKIEVNDRYQKVLGTVITLATAAFFVPVFVLRDLIAVPRDRALVGFLDCRVYLSWCLLAVSVFAGVLFYYLSAKWIKLAWGKPVAISSKLECLLDWSFWISVTAFLLGIGCFVWFATTFRYVR